MGDDARQGVAQQPTLDASDEDGAAVDADAATTCPCTIFGERFAGNPSDEADTTSTELGIRFRSDLSGKILAIRYYRGALNDGPHFGALWNASGERIASVEFTNETGDGWQTATFATPVAIQAHTNYVASYRAPKGGYASATGFFGVPLHAPPLHADIGAGLYTYGNGVPDQVYQATNYWVDVVFSP